MRRLVISDVLPSDRETILRVVHKRREPVFRRDRGREDPQLLIVGRSKNDLFTPIAKNICTQCRRRFRTVVRHTAFGNKYRISRFLFPIPL